MTIATLDTDIETPRPMRSYVSPREGPLYAAAMIQLALPNGHLNGRMSPELLAHKLDGLSFLHSLGHLVAPAQLEERLIRLDSKGIVDSRGWLGLNFYQLTRHGRIVLHDWADFIQEASRAAGHPISTPLTRYFQSNLPEYFLR